MKLHFHMTFSLPSTSCLLKLPKNESRSPWDSSLNRPVPKLFKIRACDWAQNIFCAQSESSSFRVTFVTSYSKVFTSHFLLACSPFIYLLMQESFPRSKSAIETRTMKPKKKTTNLSMFVNQPGKASTEKIRLWTNRR